MTGSSESPAADAIAAEFSAPTPDSNAWRRETRILESPLGEIAYHEAGKGPSLVLLHGFPTASWDWAKLWPALTARFRCLAPDFLGFGESEKRAGRFLISTQADMVEALLEARDVGDHHILAHDYGDTVAQEWIARASSATRGRATGLRSVCFLNGGLVPEAHRPRPIQRLLAGRFGPLFARLMTRRTFARGFREIFAPESRPQDADIAAWWAFLTENDGKRAIPGLLDYMRQRRVNRARWVGAIADWTGPMRLIDGLADPVSGGHLADRFEEIARGGDVVRLACGHYPQWEAPGETLRAFLDFHDSRVAAAA